MSTTPEAIVPEPASAHSRTPVALSRLQVLRWDVRRELWENRSVVRTPLVVAGLALVAFLLFSARIASLPDPFAEMDAAQQVMLLTRPYGVVAMAVIVSTLFVGVVYSLGALHGERRDRSILFWKSLPVSDLETVLAKAAIPIVVLPVIGFLVVALLQWTMLCVGTATLLLHHQPIEPLWNAMPVFTLAAQLAYGLAALALWLAPVHAWLLLVSAWAKRMATLWAVLPWMLLSFFEHVAFGTAFVGTFVRHRLGGFITMAFDVEHFGHRLFSLSLHPAPAHFVASPGLWGGLVFAAACLGGAAWVRRHSGPV